MRASKYGWIALIFAFAFASNIFLSSVFLTSVASAQSSDQVIADQAMAELVLGPQWKELSRRAGMIFAGTVVTSPAPTTTQIGATTAAGTPSIELTFRVDLAIAGVEPGQVLTIHEWAGAASIQHASPLISGQHVLMFLYPLSRLGLTSPVGGSRGQILVNPSVNVSQLSRAIRNARKE